jgi:hypothetical protein
MVEENSRELQQRTRALTEELRAKMKREELEALEPNIVSAMQRKRFTDTRPPSGLMKRSAAATSLGRSA